MYQGRTHELVFVAFDLLYLHGDPIAALPLLERKTRLKSLFKKQPPSLLLSDYVVGDGPRFRKHVCKIALEGVISKRIDRGYASGDRGLWVKSKCLNREEFIVVGWTDPAGNRSHIGALLLGYYTEDGKLEYAGRVGTGIADAELKRVAGALPSTPRRSPQRKDPSLPNALPQANLSPDICSGSYCICLLD